MYRLITVKAKEKEPESGQPKGARRQKAEARRGKPEGRSKEAEARRQKPEGGRRAERPETGGEVIGEWIMEDGGWRK